MYQPAKAGAMLDLRGLADLAGINEGSYTREQCETFVFSAMALVSRSFEKVSRAQADVASKELSSLLWQRLTIDIGVAQTIRRAIVDHPDLQATLSAFLLMVSSGEILLCQALCHAEKEDLSSKTYIVRNPATGLIKIGKSINPEMRVKSLETGSGVPLELLHVIDSDIERRLHKMFSGSREHLEWFRDDGKIVAYIEVLKRGGSETLH